MKRLNTVALASAAAAGLVLAASPMSHADPAASTNEAANQVVSNPQDKRFCQEQPVGVVKPYPVSSNPLQVLVDDMEQCNDTRFPSRPDDTNPYDDHGHITGPGHVVMGNEARGSNTPDYWQNALVHKDYTSDDYWQAIQRWVQIKVGPQHASTNTQVELGQMKINILSRSTNKWTTIDGQSLSGYIYDKFLRDPDGPAEEDVLADKTMVRPPNTPELAYHGYGSPVAYDTSDIKAMHVTMDAKLVLKDPNGVDDRDQAQYLIAVGADYYPAVDTRDKQDPLMLMWDGDKQVAGYFPGAGLSRSKLATKETQSFNFVTIDTAAQEPGGAISVEELLQNPPPLS